MNNYHDIRINRLKNELALGMTRVVLAVALVLLACVTAGSAQAQDSDGSLSVQTVREHTGIKWPRMTKEKIESEEIVRTLGRPFPDSGNASYSTVAVQILSDEAAYRVMRTQANS